MRIPTTAEEWWENASQPVIMDVLARFIPMDSPACKDIHRSQTFENLIPGLKTLGDILRCIQERDIKMLEYCNAAWNLAPDVPGLHEIPGWLDLCDLCSEGPDLLLPEPPDEKEELWDADPNCQHEIVASAGGGVRCKKCNGWFCY